MTERYKFLNNFLRLETQASKLYLKLVSTCIQLDKLKNTRCVNCTLPFNLHGKISLSCPVNNPNLIKKFTPKVPKP